MITSFDYFFGGHVAMTDLGFAGRPVNERVESNRHLSGVFDETLAIAQLMEPLNYDTLWLSEHHFQREGYGCIGNIPLLSVYIAAKTERLKIGAMFNTVPAWHPLRLAEDFATADILTDGRVRFGVGRGYINREVETLGAALEDDEANRDLFEEQVEIIFKAWNEESFSHHSLHYDLPPSMRYREQDLKEISLVPRPKKLPVECWQPIFSASPRGINFMVRNNIKGVILAGGRAIEIATSWQNALAKAGRETQLGEHLSLVVQVIMGDTQEQAEKKATLWHEEQLKVLAPLGRMPSLSRQQILATFDPKTASKAELPRVQDLVRDGSWICGSPEHVYERLCEIQDYLPGLERISIGSGSLGMPPQAIRDNLAWFGTEVLPRFVNS